MTGDAPRARPDDARAFAHELAHEDVRYLRSELLFRMAVQNAVLILNAVLFLGVAALQTSGVSAAAALACAYSGAATVLAAIWCHHGARQAQIKHYLLEVERREPAAGSGESWESWLPRHRIGGRLGARWVISTKLPFVATTGGAWLLALIFDRTPWWLPLTGVNLLVIAALAALLWTNPKEGPEPATPVA